MIIIIVILINYTKYVLKAIKYKIEIDYNNMYDSNNLYLNTINIYLISI